MNTEEPDIFWSRWNHCTSPVNVRFLTGVQRSVGAELRDVEVGVTGVVARSVSGQRLTRVAGGEGGAVSALGRGGSRTQQIVVGATVVPDGRVAAEQARRPVRIPVVVERAAEPQADVRTMPPVPAAPGM